jgi:hypothetical protein
MNHSIQHLQIDRQDDLCKVETIMIQEVENME